MANDSLDGLLNENYFESPPRREAKFDAALLRQAVGALRYYLMPRLVTPGLSVGEALLEAKQAMAQEYPDRLDVLLGFGLLGDPALVIDP